MVDVKLVALFFQFDSKYYDRDRLEGMVRKAAEHAREIIPDAMIEYKGIDIRPAQTITKGVIKHIDDASYCVFELSDNNPNVLFELGHAHSKGKRIALLKNRNSSLPVPSDLSGLFILYYDDPISMQNASLDLSSDIGISIKEAMYTKKTECSFARCGPSGGYGGDYFSDEENVDLEVAKLTIRSGKYIDSIQITYVDKTGTELGGDSHGGAGGSPRPLELMDGEYITEVGGRYGKFIDSLWIKTNQGVTHKWGESGSRASFSYTAPPGARIIGFFGRTTLVLDAIGVIMRIESEYKIKGII